MQIHPYNSALASPDFQFISDAVLREWNPEQYSTPVPPLVIGNVEGLGDDVLTNVLDMAIKTPDSQLILPEPVQSLSSFVLFCADVHRSLVKAEAGNYAYLTVNQGVVAAGKTQRNAGIHFDGMQGVRYPSKLPACHQFLASTALPTRWHVQPFDASRLDPNKDNWFRAFDEQALRTDETQWEPAANQVVLSTAYGVHEASQAAQDTIRSFVRLEFTKKVFNRAGNTMTALSENWDWQPRQIPDHLV